MSLLTASFLPFASPTPTPALCPATPVAATTGPAAARDRTHPVCGLFGTTTNHQVKTGLARAGGDHGGDHGGDGWIDPSFGGTAQHHNNNTTAEPVSSSS